ncbi:MAG TPA: 4-alpha-glucanotransferase [Geobacteraceae bacterium]
MQRGRKSGVLLHPTSLPGPGGIGSLGKECLQFIDFLRDAGQSLWQVLPLGPTAYGNSPYSCYSAFAGNPLLIDLETLAAEGDLAENDLLQGFSEERVDFPRVERYKFDTLRRAAERFFAREEKNRQDEFGRFCDASPWLHDYALFMAVKEAHHGKSWRQWPEGIARRTAEDLDDYSRRLAPQVGMFKYLQWQFFRQWERIKAHANGYGIEIIGDIPIFVAYDSADVWANPHLFHLDESGRPLVVAGVPPDYFSKTGQLWGNPLYNWDAMAFHGYGWWVERMRSALGLCDRVRVDHFRGFEAYWEVPATEKTAVNGRWVKGPGEALFNALIDALGSLPIIAEDLGVITPDVEALRDRFGFPGMKILQFAFGSGPDNPYLPHNHERHAVVYTGTHDNDTTAGWFAGLPEREKKKVHDYLGTDGEEVVWCLIRAALASVADTALIPLQDILSLGNAARMNVPGTPGGNWAWRFLAGDLTESVAARFGHLTRLYGRSVHT